MSQNIQMTKPVEQNALKTLTHAFITTGKRASAKRFANTKNMAYEEWRESLYVDAGIMDDQNRSSDTND